MNDERWATIIKVAAVAVAAPRWVGALLEAEGVPLPAEWRSWWVIVSAVCAAGMALVEAGAFAYCLRSWRSMTGRSANIMALMIWSSALTFVVVLAPYIAANVSRKSMATLLSDWSLLAWAVAVALSTILIVASVGYAQRRPAVERKPVETKPKTTGNHVETSGNQVEAVAEVVEKIGNYDELVATNRKRNGEGPVSVDDLVKIYGVPTTTAYRWVKRYNTTLVSQSESTESQD